MPGTDRNIVKSLMARLRALMSAPPSASGFASFSVYNEDDLINWNKGAPLPNRPFVYLLNTYMRPKVPALPMVIVDVNLVQQQPFELGNRAGRITSATIHCFGRQRGERDDLASLVADYLGATFPVYQYTSGADGDTSVFLENAEVQPPVIIEDWSRSQTPDMIREGSLFLWKQVHVLFRTRH